MSQVRSSQAPAEQGSAGAVFKEPNVEDLSASGTAAEGSGLISSTLGSIARWLRNREPDEWVWKKKIAESIDTRDQQGELKPLIDGKPDEMSKEEVVETLKTNVVSNVDQDLNLPNSELQHLATERAAYLANKSRWDLELLTARERSDMVTVITLLAVVMLAVVLFPLGVATFLELWYWDDFYYLLPDDVDRWPFYRFTDIIHWFLWGAGLLGIAMAAILIRKAVKILRSPGEIGHWERLMVPTLLYCALALAAFLEVRFDSRVESITIEMVKHPAWTVGLFAGTCLIALAVVPANLFLSGIYNRRLTDAQGIRDGRNDNLIQREVDLNKRRDDLVDDYITTGVSDLGSAPGFTVHLTNEYLLTVPLYDEFREDAWEQLTETYERNYVEVKPSADEDSYRKGLIDSIDKLRRASFGITGERGAGKTALMFALRDEINIRSLGNRRFLDVWLGAPTAFNEQEFLLSVLAKLARNVGYKITENKYFPDASPEDVLKEERIQRRNMFGALAVGLAAAMASIALWAELDYTLSLAAPVLFSGPILLMIWRRLRKVLFMEKPRGKLQDADSTLERGARDILEQLWFDQRVTTSETTGLTGIGMDYSGGTSTEKSRRPFTLPQLVQMWDDFVGLVTPSTYGKIVIFIDEVDKIKDTDEIDRFIRILKTLYRQPNLFFIVSISEDAYDLYQTRAVVKGQRNVFDSAFDQVTKLKVMSSQEVTLMFRRRIRGDDLPRPFVQLIWVISKGNARDCVRMARELVRMYQGKSITEAAPYLITNYLNDPLKEQYKSSLSTKLDPNDVQQILSAVDRFHQADINDVPAAVKLLAPLEAIIKREKAAVERGRVTLEESSWEDLWKLGTGLYIALTLRECYASGGYAATNGRFKSIDDNECLPILKEGHQLLHDGDPVQAWPKISEFRAKAGLDEIELLGIKNEPAAQQAAS